MDKKILSIVDDEQKRLVISKIIDCVNLASRHCEAKFTHFLDPATIYFAENKLLFDSDVNVSFWGGYEGAERKILCVSPEWENVSNEDFPLVCIKAAASDFVSLTHRDYLGAIMGLGIEREQIGDIVIDGLDAYIFCKKEMADYVMHNLDKVGRGGVKMSVVKDADALCTKREEKLVKMSVASLRLDSVLSGALNLSRTASADLIKSCKVKVNFDECVNLSKILSCGDLISVRGFGRLKVSEVGGETRKGRTVVFVKKYL